MGAAHYWVYNAAAVYGLGVAADRVIINPDDPNIEGGIAYSWNSTLNGWNIVRNLDMNTKAFVLPSTLSDGKPVVSIGSRAFENMTITAVVLPETLIEIGSSAFRTNLLTSITIPSTVKTIHHSAFHTNQIVSLFVPKSVTYLSDYAFSKNKLESVTFEGSLPSSKHPNNSSVVGIFSTNSTLLTGSVKVPTAQLSTYQNNVLMFGLTTTQFAGY